MMDDFHLYNSRAIVPNFIWKAEKKQTATGKEKYFQ